MYVCTYSYLFSIAAICSYVCYAMLRMHVIANKHKPHRCYHFGKMVMLGSIGKRQHAIAFLGVDLSYKENNALIRVKYTCYICINWITIITDVRNHICNTINTAATYYKCLSLHLCSTYIISLLGEQRESQFWIES